MASAVSQHSTVRRDNLGAWLLKCNPAFWDLQSFLDSGEARITSWAVQRNYRAALMRPGDRVLFWVSGPGRGGLVRGLWGDGTIRAEAEDWLDDERGRWLADEPRRAVRARVEVDIGLWDAPVPVTELRLHGLDDLEVLRMPYGSNPSWVSRPQLRAVGELVQS